ncbi:MAG: metal-dependent phosphohydrolase, partial [Bacillus sp. (in: firmicutes)]
MIPNQEQRTVKWFLICFYFILIGYDFFYYYLLPMFLTHKHSGVPSVFWYFNYVVLLILIPIMYYLSRVNKQFWIKYVFITSYLITAFTVDILTYYGRGTDYSSGNVVEIFLMLTLPLFLSKRYFWLVSLGIVVKYTLTSIILKISILIIPIILIVILSIVSFLLLVRFQGYVKAISTSYDNQLQGIVKGV